MSDFTRIFSVPLAKSGSHLTPVITQMALPLSVVSSIIIQFPPGCAGLVGASIYAGGSPAYPIDYGSFFIFDDVNFEQIVRNQITSGSWSLAAYNEDFFPHTLRVIIQGDYWVDSGVSGDVSVVSL